MPCMRPSQASTGAPATSKVATALRKESAMRKQMVAARRRRLEAIVGGADPNDAPIPTAVMDGSPSKAFQAVLDEEHAGEAGAWEKQVHERLEAGGSEAAEAALVIAQRFLGSSLGGHFTDAAAGTRPRPFALQETPRSHAPAIGGRSAAGVRVAAEAAAAAAAMMGDGSPTKAAEPADITDAADPATPTKAADAAAPAAETAEAAVGTADAAVATAEATEAAVVASMGAGELSPRSLEAVEAAIARLGLHEAHDDIERREWPAVPTATQVPSYMPADLSTATMSRAASTSRPPSQPARGGTSATSWEVDISVLRKGPPPAAKPAEDDRRGAAPKPSSRGDGLRPGPGAGGRRSHAGWSCELVL